MIISLRVNEEEMEILNNAAKVYGCGVSSMIKRIVFEKLEDEYDLQVIKEFEKRKNDNTLELVDHDDAWKEVGL